MYDTYTSSSMGISFSIPYSWLLNPSTNQETTLQFVEPKSEMMEPDGYQTRLTIERFSAGLNQTAADARTRLESVLTELEGMFTTFKANDIAAAQAVTIATTAPPITTAQRNTVCADVLPSSLTIKS